MPTEIPTFFEFLLLIVTFFIYIFPGLLILDAIFKKSWNFSAIEKILLAFALSSAIYIILAYLLPSLFIKLFYVFAPIFIIITILYFFIKFVIHIKHLCIQKEISGYEIRKILRPKCLFSISIYLLLTLVTAYFYYEFENMSPLPATWDRGKHFALISFIVLYHQLPANDPGTIYPLSNFLGYHIALSIFCILYFALSGVKLCLSKDLLLLIAKIFAFFNILVILLVALFSAILISQMISKGDQKYLITLCGIIFYMYIYGYATIIIGSLRQLFGTLFFINLLFIYVLIIQGKEEFCSKRNYFKILFIVSLLASASIFTHSLPTAYYFVSMLLFIFLSWGIQKIKKINTWNLRKPLGVYFCSLLFGIFLSLTSGFLQNVFLRITQYKYQSILIHQTSHFQLYAFPLTYNYIVTILLHPLFLFVLLGVFLPNTTEKIDIKVKLLMISLFISAIILLYVFPIPPHFRISFFMYPILVFLAVNGFHKLLLLIGANIKFLKTKKNQKVIYISMLLLSIIFISNCMYEWNYVQGQNIWRKQSYINLDILFNLTVAIENNYPIGARIVFPGSGPMACMLWTMCNKYNILFAEPRFPDMVIWVELATLYKKFPTNIGVFDFTNISIDYKVSIIEKYNISGIIATKNHPIDDRLFNYYDVKVVTVNDYVLYILIR